MHIEQLYTSCLAEAAYYIESNGEAAVIDPLRETDPYIKLAKERNAKIKYIFETHFHADFVSGHLDLANLTGAEIVYGPTAKANYKITVAKDNEEFRLGNIKLKVIHTPGHTLESMCLLLTDEDGKENCIFTGDTLFVGDVGRPDLAVKSDLTREDLAAHMYESITKKILPLPDHLTVYPGHGAGSACGKSIGKETFTTIGTQRKYNYALQPMSKEEFIKALTDGLTRPPKYFFKDAAINKGGYENIEKVIEKNTRSLDVAQFENEVKNGATILDTRNPDAFEKAFVPGSINIGLGGQYAIWAGSLLEMSTPLVLITDEGKEREAVLRLARVGYENIRGILKGGIATWEKAGKQLSTIDSMNPEDFTRDSKNKIALDVRKLNEWQAGIVKNAEMLTLEDIEEHIAELDKNKHYHIYCGGGYRSMMASSILRKHGFNKVTNIRGGFAKLKEHGIEFVTPSLN